ncbi:MAG: hypothetical protein M8353_11130, partial [ANME-2 cluster archaeon]|nr:hypothetical protein [ANME-2 cluster archaeon]
MTLLQLDTFNLPFEVSSVVVTNGECQASIFILKNLTGLRRLESHAMDGGRMLVGQRKGPLPSETCACQFTSSDLIADHPIAETYTWYNYAEREVSPA